MCPLAAAPLLVALSTAAALTLSPAAHADGGTITFVMNGLRNEKGAVLCSLHDKEDAFPRKPALAVATVRAVIKGGTASCLSSGVAPGAYAISGYHDENDNGKFDVGLLGPTEGWAASNDARGLFGPKFKDARFEYKGSAITLKGQTVY